MKPTSLRQVIVAMAIAVTAATVHGAWFASANATTEGVPVASIRMAEWDHYEQKWVASLITPGATLRNSEGAIFELRSQGTGDVSVSNVPAGLNIEVLQPADLDALDIPLPSDANLVAAASLSAVPAAPGAPTYIRLAVSTLQLEPDHMDDPLQTRPVEHEGVWTGPLSPTDSDRAALDVDGSVGVHANVTLSDGDTVSFTWDIGRWAKGDLFIGMNEFTYRVLDRTGEFKRFVASADIDNPDSASDYNITAGCAANWKTGEVFATNFADLSPAVNVITRHPSGEARSLYSPADRRIATFTSHPDMVDWGLPMDINPESVVFDAQMNMYVGHSDSILAPVTLATYTALNSGDPGLWDDPDDVYFLDVGGWPLSYSDGTYPVVVDETGAILEVAPSGVGDFLSRRIGIDVSTRLKYNGNSLVFGPTNALASLGVPALMPQTYLAYPKTGEPFQELNGASEIPGRWPMGRRIHRYNVQPDGSYRGADTEHPDGPDRDVFWAHTSRFGTDWVDLDSTGEIAYYTSEDSLIHRFRVRPGVNGEPVGQLPDVGFGQLLDNLDRRFNAIRILPPGDGSGGFLTAGEAAIYRFAQNGDLVQKYEVRDDPYLRSQDPDAGFVSVWYALEIDPGGKTFWASNHNSGWVYQFDIASGQELRRIEAVDFQLGDVDLEVEGRLVASLCVMSEYTAPQEICGDGRDNDGDGLVDENCKPIENCTNGVDEDGDLLSDNHDPDCGTEASPIAEPDLYTTDQDVNVIAPSAGALTVLHNDFDPDNAPDANPMGRDTVVVAAYGDAVPDHAPGLPLVTAAGTVTLQEDGSFLYDPAPTFHGQFTFLYTVTDGASASAPTTVTITVRPIVVSDVYSTQQNVALTGQNILANDSIAPMFVAAAGPSVITALTGTSMTFQTYRDATVELNRDGTFTYTPAADMTGEDRFVYLGSDGVSDSVTTATVTLFVSNTNTVVATYDEYQTPYNTASTRELFWNDRDPEGDTFQLTHVNGQPVTVGSVVTVALPGSATATIVVNTLAGNVTITPSEGFWGDFGFSYTIQDDGEIPATSTATVAVLVGQPAVGVQNDNYTTLQNTPLVVPALTGVLANDFNAGLPIFWLGSAGPRLQLHGSPATGPTPAGGTVTLSPDGAFTYTPPLNFVGTEVFSYEIRYGDTDIRANVSLMVAPVSTAVTVTTPDPSTYGTSAEVTATVTCGSTLAPSLGTVTFLRGSTVIAANVPVVNGVARTQLPASLPVGTHTIVARYSGVELELLGLLDVTLGCPTAEGTDTHQVIPAPLTITARAQAKPYGTVALDGDEFDVSGLLFAADTVSSVTLASPTGSPANATVLGGPYVITPGAAQGTGLGNYTISYVTGLLNVTRVPLTVTALNHSKIYGNVLTFAGTPTGPTADFAVSGLVNGQTLTSAVLSSTGAPASAPANATYPIAIASATGADLSNYVVTYVPGILTVSPRPVTVTAGSGSKVVGTPDPASLSTTQVGFLGGDLTQITLATTRVAGETVGTYVTTATAVGTPLNNYTVNFVPGVFTILSATCSTNGHLTYSQGGWGSNPSGNNPGAFLAANFSTVYPGGSVQIGGIKKLTFTSAAAIAAFLPQGGSSNVLTSNATNPSSSSAGNFAGQLLAMQLAADFSAAGVTKSGLGALVMQSGPLAGMTVDAILTMANTVIGGTTSALPSGMTMSTLSGILESLNMNFHEGTANQGLLGCSGPTPCSATQLSFTGNSPLTGTAGNLRTFSASGVSVNASAFSRVKGTGGSWASAYLGVWSEGLGVTDSSENGSGNTHRLDNSGRLNYILFEFSQSVVVTKAFLASIGSDSDATIWVGTAANPFTNHLTLSDAVLAGLGSGQSSDGGTSSRWASFNAAKVSGNVIVIAAATSASNDAFKVSKLDVECGAGGPTPPKSDKSDKSDKSSKSHKSGKSDKSGKSGKSGKSDKYSHSDKSDKSDKSSKDWNSGKSGKSEKYSHSDKSGKSDKSSKSSSKYSSKSYKSWK